MKHDYLQTDWWLERPAQATDLTRAYQRFQGPSWRRRRSVGKEAALVGALTLALICLLAMSGQ